MKVIGDFVLEDCRDRRSTFGVMDNFLSSRRIYQEFEELNYIQKQEHLFRQQSKNSDPLEASKAVNASKNRYYDVLPIDETRVKLMKLSDGSSLSTTSTSTPNSSPLSSSPSSSPPSSPSFTFQDSLSSIDDGSDYINASFVSGEVPNSYHYYIASQAPLDSTVNDFWRMIWEQKCGVIVMLTSLKEGNKNKAVAYWPELGKVSRYGNLAVCHKNIFELGNITVRSLLVKEVASTPSTLQSINESTTESTNNNNLTPVKEPEPTREIIQIQYSEWPDYGTPTSTKTIRDILSLMRRMKDRAAKQYSLTGPVTVHCSAGIGRTGTFIASDITLEKIRHHQIPNIMRTVELLRKQRPRMVMNKEQYALIYAVVRDAVMAKASAAISAGKGQSGGMSQHTGGLGNSGQHSMVNSEATQV